MKFAYRPEIDGLRAVSILLVVVFHAFPALLPGGFIGVDVFFVISGYLITRILVGDLAAGRWSLAQFYARRIRRLLPALVVVMLSSMLLGWWVLLPDELALLGRQVAAASVFLPNVLFWTESGYFDAEAGLKPLLHLWSLGVEEQFYLLWPATVLLAAHWRWRLPLVTVSLLLVSLGACLYLTPRDASAAFYLPFFRAWELCLGALLVWLPGGGLRRAGSEALVLAGLALLVAAAFLIDKGTRFPGAAALAPALAAAALLYAGSGAALSRALLANPLMTGLGRISYPLYLWHWPLLALARMIEGEEVPLRLRLTIVALSLLLAGLTWRCLERPLQASRSRWLPAGLMVLLLASGGIGYWIDAGDGFPQRIERFREQAQALQERESLAADCARALGLPPACDRTATDTRIAVLGDSHSNNLFYALAHRFAGEGGVLRLGRGGCPPLLGVETRRDGAPDTCREVVAAHVDFAARAAGIETVYLVSMSRYVQPGEQRYRLRVPGHPDLAANGDAYRFGLQATIDRLRAAGKQVVLVFDWPGVVFDPRSCVELRPFRFSGGVREECSIPRRQFLADQSAYRDLLAGVLSDNPDLAWWDAAAPFCDEQTCWIRKDDVMWYRDTNHLSPAGNRHLGDNWRLQRGAPPG
ncbi:acyltransferase family protein [Haliea sp. E17]|uniref:acyltransferase family protein n=1 Tax=Haliea sp. E17 TaxID=3401576 RepID=UPI003AAFA6AA